MKKHNKLDVIKVGERLFRAKGYHNCGTEEILDEAQYPRSSFYYHFKSKEEFAAEVLEFYGDRVERFYREALSYKTMRSPLEKLRNFVEVMTDMAVRRGFKSECLIHKLSIETASLSEPLRHTTDQQMKKILEPIEVCIKEGQNLGEIRSDTRAIQMAEFLHSQWYGGYTLSRLRNSGEILKNNMSLVFRTIQVNG